jgi:hypothetical protein
MEIKMNVNNSIKTSILAITISLISFSSFAFDSIDKSLDRYSSKIESCDSNKKIAYIELKKSIEEMISKDMDKLSNMIKEDINNNIDLKVGIGKESFASNSFFGFLKISE